MGLDVSYYRKITRVSIPAGVHEEDYIDQQYNRGMYCFHYEAAAQAWRSYLDGLPEGVYTGQFREHFRAGSYSTYNWWRELLCTVALGKEPKEIWENPEKWKDQPFFQLINFSDCEGVIGPITAEKLARDFQENRNRFIAHPLVRQPDSELYDAFQTAFAVASGGGCVVFH